MNDELKQTIGRRLLAARKRADLTQEQLAGSVERSVESISKIENGRQLPSIETLAEFSRVLGVPIAEFFDDIGRGQKLPDDRLALEIRLRELGRTLADADLAVVVALVVTFVEVRSA